MSIKISARYDSRLVRPDGSDRYLLVTLTGQADQPQETRRVPLNLSLILDRSGSMASEDKLKLVKEAAAFVVERLSDDDRVSVIAYDDQVQLVATSTRMTARARRDLVARISQIRTGGNTNLSEGWLTGCRQIAEYQTEARYVDCAWLLTDGLANAGITGQEELAMHATELRKRGISTTTFGVGLDFNEDLLRAMAEKGGGHFYFIGSSHQIKNYFEGELGERLNTVARQLSLTLQLPNGVRLENLNDYEMQQVGSSMQLNLGDVYAGEEREILFKFTVPSGTIGQSLRLSGLLRYTEAQNGAGRELSLNHDGGDLSLTYATDRECDAQVIESHLADLIARLLSARAKQEILAANKRGDYETARTGTSRLTDLLKRTFAAPGSRPASADVELVEVDNLSQAASAAPMQPAARQEAFYGSHMQQRSRKDYKK